MNKKLTFFIMFIIIVFSILWFYSKAKSPTETIQVKDKATTSEIKKEEKIVVLWKAKRDILKGERLSKKLLNRVELSESEAKSLGVYTNELVFKNELLINKDLLINSYVSPTDVTTPEESGYLKLLITDGMLLYPLKVSSRNIIDGYIKNGDYIDVISVSSPLQNLSYPKSKIENFKGVRAKAILERVKVININDDKSSKITTKYKMDEHLKTTVIIEVEPDKIPFLSLVQRTMDLEIYPRSDSMISKSIKVEDVMENYKSIRELRGSNEFVSFVGDNM